MAHANVQLPPARGPTVRLLVAEKPSVARDLAALLGCRERLGCGYLGDRLWIAWCVGHMAELAPPEHYAAKWRSWRLDGLPMLPGRFALQVAERNRVHWLALQAWLQHRRVVGLINACDAGREGELIFRYVYELAGCKQPVQRLWLQALTKVAVGRAFSHLRPAAEFDALSDAARCRAEADWLVGLNATRALTLASRRADRAAPLCSVGRVQTPTLAMVVERELAIERFVPEPYFEVSVSLQEAPALVLRAVAPPRQRFGSQPPTAPRPSGAAHDAGSPPQSSLHRFAGRAAAQAAADAIGQAQGRVERFVAKEQQRLPPLLYDLTALQREANVRFGAKAADTLAAAQALYERDKVLTYPRTDSRFLTSELSRSVPAIVERLASDGPWQKLCRPVADAGPAKGSLARMANDAEVRDHHAIVPTGQPYRGPMAALPGRIYELVVRRLLAACSPPAVVGTAALEVRMAGYLLVARGHSTVVPGWLAVDPPARPADAGEAVPPWPRGKQVTAQQSRVHALATKAPPRLTEASLLLAMERAGNQRPGQASANSGPTHAGLGTPATRAAIIETLKQRNYLVTEGRLLVPTEAGRALIARLPGDALKSAALTGEWEAKLAAVATGRLARPQFMRHIASFVANLTADIVAS